LKIRETPIRWSFFIAIECMSAIVCFLYDSYSMFSSAPKIINSEEEDAFGHYDKIEFIRKFIEDNIQDWRFLTNEYDRMIALYGGRWSGKSTIMKTLCESGDPKLQLKTSRN
jgi:hypothetical protein